MQNNGYLRLTYSLKDGHQAPRVVGVAVAENDGFNTAQIGSKLVDVKQDHVPTGSRIKQHTATIIIQINSDESGESMLSSQRRKRFRAFEEGGSLRMRRALNQRIRYIIH